MADVNLPCTALVKDKETYAPTVCKGTRFKGGLCPETNQHIRPLVSGKCKAGWHEGSKARTFRDEPAPPCQDWLTCPCTCHTTFDQMFALSGQPRIAVDNSGYSPPKSDFVMPSLTELAEARAASSNNDPVTAPKRIESPDPGTVPATLARTYAPTPTGRAARGELESMVRAVTDIWAVDKPGDLCTPGYVAYRISKDFVTKEPSVGAVDAVFKRWEKLGFATIQRKPTRFIGYTPAGIEHGLEGLKERARLLKVKT